MAEATIMPFIEKSVSAIAGAVLKPLCSMLLQKAIPPEELDRKIESMKIEFEHIKVYLRSLDTTKEATELSNLRLKDLKGVAYDIEDVIDEYNYFIGEQHRSGFFGYLQRTIGYYKNMSAWNGINSQVTHVNTTLQSLRDILSLIDRYPQVESSSVNVSERHQNLAESAHFLEEDDIVGFDTYRKNLIGWLTESEPMRTVISVWGMGGLGKTTLATTVYNSPAVKQHFDIKAWVYVSQAHTTMDLLRRIINNLCEENNELELPLDMNEMLLRKLVETLRSYLRGKRYLIVLDDVWQSRDWFELSSALLDSNCCSRIVITTRIHDVASLAVENRMIQMQPLKEKESWVLFCKKAFWNDRYRITCPREIQYWAQKIVERCQGVPLALVATGSLMSEKEKTEMEWKSVCEDLNWEDSQMPMSDNVKNILNLSFKDLSYDLRKCFLYCTIFPEDCLMKRKRLIRLWVAEGFIEQGKNKTIEEVAEGYLNRLIHRCMLQVVKRNHFGRVKLFRMHDLMRDLARVVSEKESFCLFYDSEETVLVGKARCLSVRKIHSALQSSGAMTQVRSFLLFDVSQLPQNSFRSFLARFRLLRVLDLEGIPIKELPVEVVELFNLHYLGLRKTLVKELPKSLGRLLNLQTLDIYDSSIQKLPNSIVKLKKLRHLFVESIQDPTFAELASDPGVKAPRGLWKLKELQTLQSVEADERTVQHLGELVQLRSLRITKVRRVYCKGLCGSLSRMSHLVSLDVAANDRDSVLQLDALEPPQRLLQKLELRGPLENGLLPSWLGSLENLKHLGLSWSMLREDPIPCLQALPNLAVLGLRTAYDGQEMRFGAGGFPKLKLLMLGGSNRLDMVNIEDGAMSSLSELCLLRCGGMRLVPHGIEHLTALQSLYLLEMPKEFINSLRGESNMEEQLKVTHIPVIKHIFQSEGKWVSETLRFGTEA